MTIQNNSIEQINVALLEIDSKLRSLSIDNAALKELSDVVDSIQLTLNNTRAGLRDGETYNINISGNAATASWAGTAGSATTAEYAVEADTAALASTVDSNWLLDHTYPIDSVYLSSTNVSPESELGGSWSSITAPTGMFAWKRIA